MSSGSLWFLYKGVALQQGDRDAAVVRMHIYNNGKGAAESTKGELDLRLQGRGGVPGGVRDRHTGHRGCKCCLVEQVARRLHSW